MANPLEGINVVEVAGDPLRWLKIEAIIGNAKCEIDSSSSTTVLA